MCEPRIQVGTRAELSVVYESDVGPMPLMVTNASVVNTAIATLEQGPSAERIALTGIAVGETAVELRLRGYDEPVWFSLSVESDPPMYDCDGRDPPGFDIDGSGQPPP